MSVEKFWYSRVKGFSHQ